jgi:hypothetical protein
MDYKFNLNSISGVSNYKFLSSTAVKVFPSTARKVAVDPEAKLNTEFNFTHLPGYANFPADGYVISHNDGVFKCVIHGYYFELTEGETIVSHPQYLGIKIKKVPLASVNGTTSYTTEVLDNLVSSTENG